MTSPQLFRKRLRALIKKARHEANDCPQCDEHDKGFVFVSPGERYKCNQCENVFEVHLDPLPFIDDRKMLEAAAEYDKFDLKIDWGSALERNKAEQDWEKRWKIALSWV